MVSADRSQYCDVLSRVHMLLRYLILARHIDSGSSDSRRPKASPCHLQVTAERVAPETPENKSGRVQLYQKY